MRHKTWRRRGANAVEFALVMPVLVMILTGIMEYGWFFSQQIAMVSAVRDSVRGGRRRAAACQVPLRGRVRRHRVRRGLAERRGSRPDHLRVRRLPLPAPGRLRALAGDGVQRLGDADGGPTGRLGGRRQLVAMPFG
ncbi:MAG: pilus assembly protein [Deltaproteobacteria bacterium]|nr:pilus assembly protein [Deltaproteobacteria bacterium]